MQNECTEKGYKWCTGLQPNPSDCYFWNEQYWDLKKSCINKKPGDVFSRSGCDNSVKCSWDPGSGPDPS